MASRKDILANKGTLYVFDEAAAEKKWKEIGVVDSLNFSAPTNPVEIKTPSGVTIFTALDLDASISCDWYHAGNLKHVELMFRGATKISSPTGSTLVTGEKQIVNFRKAGEAAVLGGYNGAGTAATITHIKSTDGATTYTVTTDYTVSVDATLGTTLITQVSGGTIPLGTDVVVTYDYTPLKANILKPDYGSLLVERFIMIEVRTDSADATKYRRYFLPRATPKSELRHSMLEIGKDNTSPNIMPLTFEFSKPDSYSNEALWYWIDTHNV